jgi:DNA-binding MarR family transcriptional regulator
MYIHLSAIVKGVVAPPRFGVYTCIMTQPRSAPDAPPALPCACASLRRASRAVTQLYEEALRPSGIRITQFTLLQFLALAGRPITQGMLGQLLALDSTTLSRTLKPLESAGWIRSVAGPDGRERHVELAAGGRRVLKRATPAWEAVQQRLRHALGPKQWSALDELLTSVTRRSREL